MILYIKLYNDLHYGVRMEKEKITIETIEKLADFSRLDFSVDEKEKLVDEVSGIIDMLNQCAEVETGVVSSLSCVTVEDLREDSVEPSLGKNDAFLNAPLSKNGYYGVPRVVE